MRILFTSHSSGLAGAEQSLVQLVREAAKRGHRGTIALPEVGPIIESLAPFDDSFPVVILRSRLWMGRRFSAPVGMVRLVQAISDLPAYLRLLQKHNFDRVVVNSSVSPVPLLAGFISKVPTLLIVRESLMTNPMLRSVLPKHFIRKLLATWSSQVVTISKYIADQYGYMSTVIYPQVGRHFLEHRPSESPPRQNDIVRAVMFGTISPEKGQLEAIEAVRMARDRGAQVTLDIYGHGTKRDLLELKSKISELMLDDVVRFKNSTSDVLSAYRAADISIVCSKNEAFGKVTAESVLAGRPVVAYGCGGTTEILAEGGGICTAPNSEALSQAVVDICNDDKLMRLLQKEASQSRIRTILAATAQQVLDRVEGLSETPKATDHV